MEYNEIKKYIDEIVKEGASMKFNRMKFMMHSIIDIIDRHPDDNLYLDRASVGDFWYNAAKNIKDDLMFFLFLGGTLFKFSKNNVAFTTKDGIITMCFPDERMVPMDDDMWRRWYFIYCHECLHQIWDTFGAGDEIEKQTGKPCDFKVLNIASDCVINDYLDVIANENKERPVGGIFPDFLKNEFGINYNRRVDNQISLYFKIMNLPKDMFDKLKNMFGGDDFDGKRIKPKEIFDGPKNPPGPKLPPTDKKQQKLDPAYVDGYSKAIKDVFKKGLDPIKEFGPMYDADGKRVNNIQDVMDAIKAYAKKNHRADIDKFITSDMHDLIKQNVEDLWIYGYIEGMFKIKEGLEKGVTKPSNNSNSDDEGAPQLPQIPWDMSDAQDDDDDDDVQTGGQDKKDKKDDNDSNDNSNNDGPQGKGDGGTSAKKANDNAKRAQEAAKEAKRKAEESGDAEDAKNAKDAEEAAEEAQKAADEAAENAKNGDGKAAAEAAQRALDAANKADNANGKIVSTQESARKAQDAAQRAQEAAVKAKQNAEQSGKPEDVAKAKEAADAAAEAAEAAQEAADAASRGDKDGVAKAEAKAQEAADKADKAAHDSTNNVNHIDNPIDEALAKADEAAHAAAIAKDIAQKAKDKANKSGSKEDKEAATIAENAAKRAAEQAKKAQDAANKAKNASTEEERQKAADDAQKAAANANQATWEAAGALNSKRVKDVEDGSGRSTEQGSLEAGDDIGDIMTSELIESAIKNNKQVVEEWSNVRSGTLGKLIQRTKLGIRNIKNGGLVALAPDGRSSWASQVEQIAILFINNKIKRRAAELQTNYKRFRRGFAPIKPGETRVIEFGTKRKKEKINFDLSLYVDISGSMDHCYKNAFDSAYKIVDDIVSKCGSMNRDTMDADKVGLKAYTFTTTMRNIPWGTMLRPNNGGTYALHNLIADIKQRGEASFMNLIISDAGFSGVNEEEVLASIGEMDGIFILVTNVTDSHYCELYERLQRKGATQCNGKFKVVFTNGDFSIKD